jgi:hypothetical protein
MWCVVVHSVWCGEVCCGMCAVLYTVVYCGVWCAMVLWSRDKAVLAVLLQAAGAACQVSEQTQTQNVRWGQMYTSHDRFQLNKLYS